MCWIEFYGQIGAGQENHESQKRHVLHDSYLDFKGKHVFNRKTKFNYTESYQFFFIQS